MSNTLLSPPASTAPAPSSAMRQALATVAKAIEKEVSSPRYFHFVTSAGEVVSEPV